MDITFLIGNGLDLHLGMETTYCAFYKEIMKSKYGLDIDGEFDSKLKIDNLIYKDIYDKKEHWNLNWSDFELQLGIFTKTGLIEIVNALDDENKKSNVIETFLENFVEVISDLSSYLSKLEHDFFEENVNLNSRVLDETISCFFKELQRDDMNIIQKAVAINEIHNFNFITFNYTTCLERMMEMHTGKYQGFYFNNHSEVLKPIHIHGTLTHLLTLGVDNVNQLNEELFPEDDLIDLIKQKSLDESKDSMKLQAVNTINESDIIIIYGMSLGETDTFWWNEVLKWLKGSASRKLILHVFEGNGLPPNTLVHRSIRKAEQSAQNLILKYSVYTKDETEELRSRIFPIINTQKMFNLTKAEIEA